MSTKEIIKYYLVWQMALVVVPWLAQFWLPIHIGFIHPDSWRANFDGIHYLSIADRGYGYLQQAFFPLYPNLIRLGTDFLRPSVSVGILLSNLFFGLGLIIFNKLLLLDYDKKTVKWTVLALLVFPTSFYFGAVYTESLFLSLVLLSFYCARKEKWWLAGIFGGLASYTRLPGIFLFPALLLDSKIRKSLPLFLIPLGLFCYMFYLYETTGDPLLFVHVQKYFGQGRSDNLIMLYQVFWRYFRMLTTVSISNTIYPTLMLEFGVSILFLFVNIYALTRHRLSYAIFASLAFIIPTLTGNLASMTRYVLVCFVGFIVIGDFIVKHKNLQKIYLSISVLLFVVFLSLFSRGYWVG